MKIAVYAQSNTEIGMGHVVRMSHLIDLFKARGHHVDIISNKNGQNYFASRGHHAFDVEDTKVVMNTEIAIVDHMITDNAYLQAIRPRVRKLVVIVGAGHTITPETRWIADLVVYQCPQQSSLYGHVPGENILSGFKHLILHPKYAYSPDETKDKDFVAYFGGGVRDAFAQGIVEELRDQGYKVDWAGLPCDFWRRDLHGVLSSARSFIGTMGMVTYEALATFTHPIVFCRSDDHLDIAERLQTRHEVTNLGLLPQRSMSTDKYIDQIIDAHENRPLRLIRQVDGKGAYRVAREILKC